MKKALFHPLAPLILFSIALTAILSVYTSAGVALSKNLEAVISFTWTVLFALWLVSDSRRRQQIPCFDLGFFAFLFLPMTLVWYCLWSRGLRGFLVLAAIVAIWLAPGIIESVIWLAMH